MTVEETPTKAGGKEWIGLVVLALPMLLLSLDLSVLLLALPQLSSDLGAGSIQQLWITDIYGFMIAGFLVTMGTLGDRIGRRRLLLIGAAVFGVASIVAAFSTSAEMLIASRAVLGIAGAAVAPSTLALASNMFRDPVQQGFAIAAVFSCFLAGGALGPVVGGVMLEFFWWGSVFLLGAPVMALLLILGPVLLPEHRDGQRGGRLDLASVALSLATILPAVWGLKELANEGLASMPVVALAGGVAFGVVFVSRQRRLADPLLDLSLFRDRSFSAALSINVCSGVVLGGLFLFVTQYLQLVAGLAPLRAGLWLAPATLAMVTGTMLAPILARRFRPAYVMAAGLTIAAASFLLLTRTGDGGSAVVVVGFAVGLFGSGLPGGLGVNMIVGSAPPEKAGSASSVSETSQELGLSLGFAILGSLGAAVYRSQMADAIPPGAPDAARESLAGAVSATAGLPAGPAAGLLDSAHEAFTAGLSTTAGIGAAVFLVLAVVAAVVLRHVPATGEARSDEAGAGNDPQEAPVYTSN